MKDLKGELFKETNLDRLEKTIGVEFENKNLLRRAVTHKSYPNENHKIDIKDNERLEFLGDSVLGLAISTYLFNNYEKAPEGKLAKVRAILVSSDMLAKKAKSLNLSDHLLLGHGEELTGGRDRDSILADSLEAILGAIYLEKNFSRVKNFIINVFHDEIINVWSGNYEKDYKTILQEKIQKNCDKRPEYFVVAEEGPDHNKSFVVEVRLESEILGDGRGSSKKTAEQQAAQSALENMQNNEINGLKEF